MTRLSLIGESNVSTTQVSVSRGLLTFSPISTAVASPSLTLATPSHLWISLQGIPICLISLPFAKISQQTTATS